MTTQTNTYRSFNTASFQGRIFDATVAEGKYGEFVAITVITNLADDDGGCTITFNNSNGLLALAQEGLPHPWPYGPRDRCHHWRL